ncbi:type IV toxin-antitoxin system AbiEi family antitoxin domain-containing protein [Candidatus Saganbacteria bacterium]|nr:type IV toxin-antitoxin system AbiEi family antitoxin domain-containing protein [Candidatus Saganbacteria bacterium]
MKLPYLENILKTKQLKLFSSRDLRLLLNLSTAAASRLIWRYEKKGLIVKLRRGLYTLTNYSPANFLIANALYQPSYISFDTALSYHGIIGETIYSVTSSTTRTTRTFQVSGIKYDYHRLKKTAFTGYKLFKYADGRILMAEPEKALADYLYYVDIKQRSLHYERLNLKKINRIRLMKFAQLFGRPKMMRLIKDIYANRRESSRIY